MLDRIDRMVIKFRDVLRSLRTLPAHKLRAYQHNLWRPWSCTPTETSRSIGIGSLPCAAAVI